MSLKIKWEELTAHFKRVDRIFVKIYVLIFLCGSSLLPAVRAESPIAKSLGIFSSIALTILAALYLFSNRRSFKNKEKDNIE
jgi:hypothetical protein